MNAPTPAFEWLYLPPIESADMVHRHDDGTIRIECYTNLQSAGVITYRYMVGVYPSGSKLPLLLVTSETSPLLEQSDPGLFALGVFSPEGHSTVGMAPEYGHWNVFLDKAVEIVESFLAERQTPTA